MLSLLFIILFYSIHFKWVFVPHYTSEIALYEFFFLTTYISPKLMDNYLSIGRLPSFLKHFILLAA